MKTTPPPPKNILSVVPELKAEALTTVRLHPRRKRGLSIDQSKIGGVFLWPKEERWPMCESVEQPGWLLDWDIPPDAEIPLAPVLQLRSQDVPELGFFPGTDLFQLLWEPIAHDEPIYVAKPMVKWRNSADVRNPRKKVPASRHADPGFVPPECELFPERVVDYPDGTELTAAMLRHLDSWDISDVSSEPIRSGVELYECSLGSAPGKKIGGHIRWMQSPEIPECSQGHAMSHLLTIDTREFDNSTKSRWCPLEDREVVARSNKDRLAVQMPAFGDLDGRQYIFICRQCPDWPIAFLFQR